MGAFAMLAPVATSAVGAAVSASSSVASGQMQANAAMANAQSQKQAYEYNAQVAKQNAVASLQAADADAMQQARVNSLRHGKLITQVMAQGVQMTGTPLLILDEDTAQGKLEEEKIKHKGLVEATNYGNQATLQRYYGQQAEVSGVNQANAAIYQGQAGATSAGVSLLGTIGGAAGNYFSRS